MNNITLFSSLTLLVMHIPLCSLATAATETPQPQHCYTEDSLKQFNAAKISGLSDPMAFNFLKKKPINVNVKQTADAATASTLLDASETKITGGKIYYQWGNNAYGAPTFKVKTPEQGYTTRVQLKVRDEECDNESIIQITVPSK